MSGLARIAKMYGGMTINGKRYVWDYVADKAVPESEMPVGSKRWIESERAKWPRATAGQAS
jgi:hypothetical protein